MSFRNKTATVLLTLFPIVALSKISRAPMSDGTMKPIKSIEAAVKNIDMDLLKAPEVTQTQKGFFTAVSYSLFSPSFDSDSLKTQNQESLGLSTSFGYSHSPYVGMGMQASLGILQNSKTDRSLPDFVLLKPAVSVLYSTSKAIFFTAGVFVYTQQGESLKNFQSYIGQEYFVGYKANKTINIKFGFSYSKFSDRKSVV